MRGRIRREGRRGSADRGAKAIDQLLSQVSFVDIFNFLVFIVFTVCYAYQLYYVLVVLTRKPKAITAKKNHKFAVTISARNEEAVIGNLIHSIKVQNYPQELIDVFVVADNCTDDTAKIARESGAIVFPRFNDKRGGQGLRARLLPQVHLAAVPGCRLRGVFRIRRRQRARRELLPRNEQDLRQRREGLTSYRNSKNYDSNWISAGYARCGSCARRSTSTRRA